MPNLPGRVDELGDYLRQQRLGARLSVRELAKVAGVSNPYLSQIERGLRKPSAEVLQQLANGLRISAEALYVRAGILDSEGRPDVEAAVAADALLTDRQRRVLLDIYASFVAENTRTGGDAPVPSTPSAATLAARAGLDQEVADADAEEGSPVAATVAQKASAPRAGRKGTVRAAVPRKRTAGKRASGESAAPARKAAGRKTTTTRKGSLERANGAQVGEDGSSSVGAESADLGAAESSVPKRSVAKRVVARKTTSKKVTKRG